MRVLDRYRSALTTPGIPQVLAPAFVCRLLSGMVSLALLLAAAEASGSYAIAGLVGGAYAFALAFTSPLWGRVADRWGPRRALAIATTLQSSAFLLFVIVAVLAAWPWLLVGTAFLAGACTPPAAAVSNTVLQRVPDEAARRTLFAMSSLFTETVFIAGPLIVAGIETVLHPLYAVVASAVFSSVGTWWLRGARLVRELDRDRPSLATGLGIAWTARLAHVMLVVTVAAFAIGALQVSVVAHADDLDVSAGVLLSLIACGGVAGSFLYGGLRLPGSLPAQLVASLGLYGVLITTLGVAPGTIVTAALLLLTGLANGPADAIETMLVGEHTPAGGRSQAFAVLIAANWIGFAAGTAAAGVLVERGGVRPGVLSAAIAALLAAASLVPWAMRVHRAPGDTASTGP